MPFVWCSAALCSAPAGLSLVSTKAEAFQLCHAPRPFCLQGDSENYYDPSNSLLPFVLATRKGIPISLAIVHAAVGRRAGLPIEFVGMPMHFMNKLGAADTSAERFIDVFAGGKMLDRCSWCQCAKDRCSFTLSCVRLLRSKRLVMALVGLRQSAIHCVCCSKGDAGNADMGRHFALHAQHPLQSAVWLSLPVVIRCPAFSM